MSGSSGKRKTAPKAKEDSNKKPKTVSVFVGDILQTDEEVRTRDSYSAELPTRNKAGVLIFKDAPEFQPNMSPAQVLQAGSFGGTYFRPISSSVTGLSYDKQWEELPQSWLEGCKIAASVARKSGYDKEINTYRVKCGGDLDMWESSGWMVREDPYGWFQWFCRFYLGRRIDDDERQIKRWKNCTGAKGRWKNNLIGKVVKAECAYDNMGISPVIRQTLQHWGYRLNKADFEARKKIINKK